MESLHPKVVVIGGGLAGLTTAYRLQERGVDVELFEARSRVGGRILTVYIDDIPVDLGGQNVSDGGEAGHLHNLAKELGITFNAMDAVINNCYFDGEEIIPVQQLLAEKKFEEEALKARIRELLEDAETLQDILMGILDRDDPLYRSIAVRLAAYEGASVDKLSPFYSETLMHMLLGGISAAHPGSGEGKTMIHLLRIDGGAFTLPMKLAGALQSKIHLNMPLKEISKGRDGGFSLSFANGNIVPADFVVFAVPCPVYEDISFGDETIPQNKLEAIRSIRYGGNSKIVVPCTNQTRTPDVLINDRALCFFDSAHPLCTLYYTGEASSFSEETIDATYLYDRKMLESFGVHHCPPYVNPAIAKDIPFKHYSTPVGFSWPMDPYSRGSYSYISPGQERLFTDLTSFEGEIVKTLFIPIGQKIFFAGEHTSILQDYPGTMESACESGERTARMVAKCISAV